MEYLILRDLGNSRRLLERQIPNTFPGPFGPQDFGMSPGWTDGPARYQIDTETVTPSEAEELARDPSVLAGAPNMPTSLIRPDEQTQPDVSNSTWGISAVGADVSDSDGSGVVVAVLDTGIDASHEAFAGVNLVQEDFTESGMNDIAGHGTHCAGTIFGRDVGGNRVGVARGVSTALIAKVLDNDGHGSSKMLFDAMIWASQNGADVISMSLGFDFPRLVDDLVNEKGYPADLATSLALESYRSNFRFFESLMSLIKASEPFGRASIVVASSGNSSHREIHPNYEAGVLLPAAAEGVVSVGALEQSSDGYKVAHFSNTGPTISAPGVNILSAKAGGGLVSYSGTSMACPHVAGCFALWWQWMRSSPIPPTIDNVKARLLARANVDGLAPGVDISDRGVGLVQAP